MAIRYKVVKKLSDGRRSSCWIRCRFSLFYYKGEVIKPIEGTKIFVFKRRYQAEKFIQEAGKYIYINNWQILRVETIGKGITLKSRPMAFGFDDIKLFWRNFDELLKLMCKGKTNTDHTTYYHSLYSLNDGTMLYDAVKVLT